MAESSLVKRLGIKAGHRLLVLNAPAGYLETLGPLPEDVAVETKGNGTYD